MTIGYPRYSKRHSIVTIKIVTTFHKVEKTALDRGRTDRIRVTHDTDLDLQSPASYCHDLLTCKCSRSAVSRLRRESADTNGRTDGRTDTIALPPTLMRSVINEKQPLKRVPGSGTRSWPRRNELSRGDVVPRNTVRYLMTDRLHAVTYAHSQLCRGWLVGQSEGHLRREKLDSMTPLARP